MGRRPRTSPDSNTRGAEDDDDEDIAGKTQHQPEQRPQGQVPGGTLARENFSIRKEIAKEYVGIHRTRSTSPLSGNIQHMEKPSCASCKHQRRRCNACCPLAPYFPPDRLAQFLNVHKLFGVSNVLIIIKDLEPQQRDDAMRTIIFQAEMRARDPVRGCLGVIEDLKRQINWSRAKLEVSLAHFVLSSSSERPIMAFRRLLTMVAFRLAPSRRTDSTVCP
ncbi:LOB domain-containing protein 22 [Nymphaea thermarum]|nr:LOB domain-containing protein 22 [Nymphaea thermarum]